jgi:N-acetyl sugar amidotransferase
MNPLTVTWAPHIYTDIGWRNLQSWFRTGIDNILVTANPVVHGTLTRLAFEILVNPFQPFIIGQKITAPKLALKYGVKLIMYGENHAEAHNALHETETSLMNPDHYTMVEGENLYFGGVPMDSLQEYGISRSDMNLYIPPTREEVENAGIEIHFLSHFINWSPQANYYYAKEYSAFESNPDGRSEGTYSKYASLDDKIDGLHYYTMFIKFGQGRAMNDACRDIRDELITRDEGVSLVRKYDGEFPKKYYRECLDYMGISHERFVEVIDNARSPHLWKYENGEWKLKHQV